MESFVTTRAKNDKIPSTEPKFLIHGEADEIFPLQNMWQLYGTLNEPKELVVIDSADHLFHG